MFRPRPDFELAVRLRLAVLFVRFIGYIIELGECVFVCFNNDD